MSSAYHGGCQSSLKILRGSREEGGGRGGTWVLNGYQIAAWSRSSERKDILYSY